jgi:hypothetical protein
MICLLAPIVNSDMEELGVEDTEAEFQTWLEEEERVERRANG